MVSQLREERDTETSGETGSESVEEAERDTEPSVETGNESVEIY